LVRGRSTSTNLYKPLQTSYLCRGLKRFEEVWKRFGRGLEEVWKRFGRGLEEVLKRF
jgi:hypothetical protein